MKRKQLSGGAKLKKAGKHAILLGVSPEVYEKLRRGAQIQMRPLSQFIVYHAVKAAEAMAARNGERL
jgi:uncharacterized protein (DUF1778 family)